MPQSPKGAGMITMDDIAGLTCLTRAEIDAIADHEHIPEIAAAALGEYTMNLHHGPQAVQAMICEDIRTALHDHDPAHARNLFETLRAFVAAHPEAVRGAR